jgi:FkbH-like protein
MKNNQLKAILLSDFNASNFCSYLNNDGDPPSLRVENAPYGQVIPQLLALDGEFRKKNYDFAVVWTQPEKVIEPFNRCLNFQAVTIEEVLQEVDTYSELLQNLLDSAKYVFVPSWVVSPSNNLFGILDFQNEVGVSNVLMRMNLRLSENLSSCSNLFLLNSQKWFELAGKESFNSKLWYLAKIPFSNDVFKAATREIKSAVRGISGKSKKIIVLDLDNTLWGGIVGEEGLEHVVLGGHDPRGEAFIDFQKTLKAISNRGILLGIVSKNSESVALEAIQNHPEMILSLKDFSGWRINWGDKAKNLADLMADLNLGIDSAVFIDDTPAERARVREALPEVLVPDWPENPMLYKETLLSLQCFNPPTLSEEDLQRKEMYSAEKQRSDIKNDFESYGDWLKTLEINLKVEELNENNIQRLTQILNKTNQMNLTTRRLQKDELLAWANKTSRRILGFRVSDKFGDMGLAGLASLDVEKGNWRIADFILSCRVMGRMVEEAMLFTIVKISKELGADELSALYIPTPKNAPCFDWWKNKSGFVYDDSKNTFCFNFEKDYPAPGCIKIGEGLPGNIVSHK